MKYYNPVISGFFPDPSICTDGEKASFPWSTRALPAGFEAAADCLHEAAYEEEQDDV